MLLLLLLMHLLLLLLLMHLLLQLLLMHVLLLLLLMHLLPRPSSRDGDGNPLEIKLLQLFDFIDTDYLFPLKLSGNPLLGLPNGSLGVPIME